MTDQPQPYVDETEEQNAANADRAWELEIERRRRRCHFSRNCQAPATMLYTKTMSGPRRGPLTRTYQRCDAHPIANPDTVEPFKP